MTDPESVNEESSLSSKDTARELQAHLDARPQLEAKRGLDVEPKEPVEALPETLGFVETPELVELRGQLVEAIASGRGETKELATRYHLLAEEVVNQREGADYAKAQIGLIVQMGLIRRDGGRVDHYAEDLEDALTYAWNERLDDTVATLEAAIEAAQGQTDQERGIEVAEAEEPTSEQLAQACSEVLPAEDCEELAAMPIEEATGYAFTLLLENGVEDPEEYLKSKGILE